MVGKRQPLKLEVNNPNMGHSCSEISSTTLDKVVQMKPGDSLFTSSHLLGTLSDGGHDNPIPMESLRLLHSGDSYVIFP